MVRLGELMMILELRRQGLSVTAIARRTGCDPKTVRKYIERGIEAPAYGPRSVGRPSKLAPYMGFVRERVTAFPDLSAVRLTREIRELGYAGAYTAVKRYLAAHRPENGPKPYEVRFETPPGVQAQVDFARFVAAASLDLAVEAFERIGGVQFGAMLGWEAHVGQDIGFSIIHQRRQLRHARPGLVGDLAPLLAGRRCVVLGERGADPS
jgi:transposase